MESKRITWLREQSARHRTNLDSLLEKHGLTQSSVTEAFMKNSGSELPLEIQKEVFYLDAFTSMSNQLNFKSGDKSDWTIEDYLSDMFDDILAMIEVPDMVLESAKNFDTKDGGIPLKQLFLPIIVTAVQRHDK